MEIERILEKYEPMMHVIINQLGIDNRFDKEDMLQELRMHLVMLLKKEKILNQVRRLDNYVFIALKRKAITVCKNNSKTNTLSLNQYTDENKNEYVNYLKERDLSALERAIYYEVIEYMNDNFSEQEKYIIYLYFYEYLSFKQIGDFMHFSGEKVRRIMNRKIEQIRRWYK